MARSFALRCRSAAKMRSDFYKMTNASRAVLLIEDDREIRHVLRTALELEQYRVIEAENGERGITELQSHRPDVVVLDLGLPDCDGVELIRKARSWSTVPIVVLSARTQEEQKVSALEAGADDYVTKPFGVRELLARIHALLRRSSDGTGGATCASATFQIGLASIDSKAFQLSRGRTVEELTAKELKLLQLFFAHPGEVMSRDRLLNEVWGYNYFGTTRTLDQVIVQLRKKLGDNGSVPKHLVTVHGVGYKLMP
jgi:DNA-binding response OmpR family regulator